MPGAALSAGASSSSSSDSWLRFLLLLPPRGGGVVRFATRNRRAAASCEGSKKEQHAQHMVDNLSHLKLHANYMHTVPRMLLVPQGAQHVATHAAAVLVLMKHKNRNLHDGVKCIRAASAEAKAHGYWTQVQHCVNKSITA
jgi:hypothetical protein